MLVLTRKVGERIILDNHIVLEVLSVKGDRVRLGIEAPKEVHVVREELLTAGPAGSRPAVATGR
jgi:carbon storage regulator